MAKKTPGKRRRKRTNGSTVSHEELPNWPEKLVGAKHVRVLDKLLQQLRGEEEHGNRQLFLDDVFIAYLLAFFNPTIRSLRTIEDLSQTKQGQKHLSVRKICKSTLSDFNKLVEPEGLVPIVDALRQQLAKKQAQLSRPDDGLNDLLERTVAVDGTFLNAASEVAWAVAFANDTDKTRHRARLDAQINVSSWLPDAIVVPDPGESESNSAIKLVQPGRIYLYDRGYTGYALIKAHYSKDSDFQAAESHFVIRYKKPAVNASTLRQTIEKPLTEKDREAGVLSDQVGYLQSDTAKRQGISQMQLREVNVSYEDQGETKTLRLFTNLLDVSAETVATLYRYRWQVELFFRWLKSIGNFGQLISHTSKGVMTHLYVTIIGVMLMYLHTGYRPSKYMFAMMSQVSAGAAGLEEILPILRERERRSELDRLSAARRRAKKKAANG